MLSPISPPIKKFYFLTATEWPYCEDTRSEWWRLFSHQLIHAGYLHVLSNQLMLLVFGSFYESNQGFLRTFLILEASILAGCLGHAAVWPMRALIGNSHGVYGLFGACMAEIIVNADTMPTNQTFALLFMCFVQISVDVLGFLLCFNPHIVYAAHTAGFCSGLLLSFTISSSLSKRMWKYILGAISIVSFACCLWYALEHYEHTWPPEALLTPSWSDVSSQTCCVDALFYQESLGVSQEEVTETYSCYGWELVEK
jgi:rhomboid protease GluP